MRLVYLTAKQYPGGTADHHYIRNLANSFYAQLGDRFTFVVVHTKKNALPDLPIVNLNFPRIIKRTLAFFMWVPRYWFVYLKKFKEEPVVFFSNDLNLLTVLIFWKKTLRLPYVVVSDWHLLTHTWKDRFVAFNSDLAFTTSKKLRDKLMSIAPLLPISTVYGGINLFEYKNEIDKNDLRADLNLPQEKILVGYVGRFKTLGLEKGIVTMIEALPNIGSSVTMVFVGGLAEEIEYYRNIAKKINVLKRCLFLPVQTFNRVAQYEQALDILVIPYPDEPHFRNYGFPMKVYEYMASGTPIIYTKLPLSEEMLSDCAFSVTPDDPKAMADVIHFVNENTAIVEEKTRVALRKVKEYTWDKKAGYILQLIKNNHTHSL